MLCALQTDKRECVLSVALEHGLVGFIRACISQWSTAGNIMPVFIATTVIHLVYYVY